MSLIETFIFVKQVNPLKHKIIRLFLITISAVLLVVTVSLISKKQATSSFSDVFILWTLSCITYLIAFIPFHFSIKVRQWIHNNKKEILIVVGLTIIALILRFISLGKIPDILLGDEGNIGVLAKSFANNESKNIFATVYGTSTMYLMFIGKFLNILGNNALGLRITSAIAGTLSIPIIYILSRRMFNGRVAIITSCLLVFSHIHLHFSRVIVNGGIQDVLFSMLAFLFLYEGLTKQKKVFFVLSGLTIGVHLYFYMGGRLMVILVPLLFISLAILDWKKIRYNIGGIISFFGALLISGFPMFLFAINHYNEFNARFNQIGIFNGWLSNEVVNSGHSVISILINQLKDSFLTINYFPVTAFYNSAYPVLDIIAGSFFVLGLVYSIINIREIRFLILNGWFWAGIVVNALVVLPYSGVYRILIILPAVLIFVAVGIEKMTSFSLQFAKNSRILVNSSILFLIIISVGINFKEYWIDWVPKCLYGDVGTNFASRIGVYLASQPSESQVFLAGAPFIIYGTHASVDFLSGGIKVKNILDPIKESPKLTVDSGKPIIFIFAPNRKNEIAFVKNAFPNGEYSEIQDCSDLSMFIYRVMKK